VKFKLDENLPVELAQLLREKGHDAHGILDESLKGESDSRIASVCREERRALVTLDVGFGDIRTYPPADYPGLMVLRLKRQDKASVLAAFGRALGVLEREKLAGTLWIVEEDRVRMRS
jgi:predicted nuclease of predicted toxin-antitoxin system